VTVTKTFATINILIDRITREFGIGGNALSWLQSFLTGRMQYVGVGDAVCDGQLSVD